MVAMQEAPTSILRNALTALLLMAAALIVLTGLFAVANFAWREPMFDQYRLYPEYLALPFPDNVLQLQNGHRPIFPSLLRVAEIRWLHANQSLQIVVGACLASFTVLIAAFACWRDRRTPPLPRAVAVVASATAVFWFGNARMLLHGNEAIQVYLVTSSVMFAALTTWKAHASGRISWLVAACVACFVATFSFGAGIASFGATLIVGWLLRLPRAWLLLPLGIMTICLVVYLFVLPGGSQVITRFEPAENFRTAAAWLGSPWMNAWLGFADPAWHPEFASRLSDSWSGRLLLASATLLGGTSVRNVATTVGSLGLAAAAFAFVRHLRKPPVSVRETLAFALLAFAAATAVIIGITRLDYFAAHPDQLFADRYLVWPCLFWLGLIVLGLGVVRSPLLQTAAGFAAIGALLMLMPSHRTFLEGAVTVYRAAQQSAAAARSGIVDPKHAGIGDGDIDLASVIALLRKHRLAMFARPGWELVGKPLSVTVRRDAAITATAIVESRFDDPATVVPVARVVGRVKRGVRLVSKGRVLLLVDANDDVVGTAELSFDGLKSPLRLGRLRPRGFDGYVHGWSPDQAYRVIALAEGGDAILVAELPPQKSRQ